MADSGHVFCPLCTGQYFVSNLWKSRHRYKYCRFRTDKHGRFYSDNHRWRQWELHQWNGTYPVKLFPAIVCECGERLKSPGCSHSSIIPQSDKRFMGQRQPGHYEGAWRANCQQCASDEQHGFDRAIHYGWYLPHLLYHSPKYESHGHCEVRPLGDIAFPSLKCFTKAWFKMSVNHALVKQRVQERFSLSLLQKWRAMIT